MGTIHNEANKDAIAKTVIMPGDPKRAELIAKNYLTDYKLVNDVRGMKAFTGFYKGKRITVMASGMGMPSMGIYSYELYKFYDVDNIIRIGSCGGHSDDLKLLDIVLVDKTYTEGNYALSMNNDDTHVAFASDFLNNKIEETAKSMNCKYKLGATICSEVFDLYMEDSTKFFDRVPKDIDYIACEMEAFALFYNAKMLGKNASCLLTVVDDAVHGGNATAEEREKNLMSMIELALNTVTEL